MICAGEERPPALRKEPQIGFASFADRLSQHPTSWHNEHLVNEPQFICPFGCESMVAEGELATHERLCPAQTDPAGSFRPGAGMLVSWNARPAPKTRRHPRSKETKVRLAALLKAPHVTREQREARSARCERCHAEAPLVRELPRTASAAEVEEVRAASLAAHAPLCKRRPVKCRGCGDSVARNGMPMHRQFYCAALRTVHVYKHQIHPMCGCCGKEVRLLMRLPQNQYTTREVQLGSAGASIRVPAEMLKHWQGGGDGVAGCAMAVVCKHAGCGQLLALRPGVNEPKGGTAKAQGADAPPLPPQRRHEREDCPCMRDRDERRRANLATALCCGRCGMEFANVGQRREHEAECKGQRPALAAGAAEAEAEPKADEAVEEGAAEDGAEPVGDGDAGSNPTTAARGNMGGAAEPPPFSRAGGPTM